MNKKEIVMAPAVIPIILIIGVVLLIAFFVFPNVKYTLIGVSIIGVTLVFIAPSAISGDFTREKMLFVVLMIFVGIFVIFLPQMGLVQQTQISGFSVLSITNAQFNREENLIRVVGAANGAEGMNINFRKEELNSFFEDAGETARATRDVEGFLQLTKQRKLFRISPISNSEIYTLLVQQSPSGNELSCSASDCGNPPTRFVLHGAVRGDLFGCNCVYKTLQGSLGNFLTGSERKEFEAFLNIGSDSVTIRDTDRTTAIPFGNNNRIQWVGELGSLRDITAPDSQVLFRGSGWLQLVGPTADAQLAIAANGFGDCLAVSRESSPLNILFPNRVINGVSFSELQACANSYNNRIFNNVLDSSQNFRDEYRNVVEDIVPDGLDSVGFVGNEMYVDLKKALDFPVFTIDLNADSVGIIDLEGDPKILESCGNVEFTSGSQKLYSILVENQADNPATFTANINCDGSILDSADSVFFGAQESKDMEIVLSGTNTEISTTRTESCTLTVRDSKDSSETDSCSFTAGVKWTPDFFCSPICISNDIKRSCDSSGVPVDVRCEESCKIVGGTPSCVSRDTLGDAEQPGSPFPVPEDPEDQCIQFIQTLQTREGTDNGLLGWRKLFGAEKRFTETKCVASQTFLLLLFGAIFLIIVVFMIISTKPKTKKGSKNKK